MSVVEHLTIYDFFNETPVEKETISQEEVEAAFNELLLLLKENGNPYSQDYFIKQEKFRKFIPSFRNRGWLVTTDKKDAVVPTMLNYHTVDEVVQTIHEYIQTLYIRIGNGETIHWYEDTWRKWNSLKPVRLAATREDHLIAAGEICFHVDKMERELAIFLGWEHYLKDEKSRGSKMESFVHKAYKKHFIPFFKENILKINNYEEMEKFVNRYYLMGRWDWWSDKHFKLPPRPNIEKLSLSPLQIACLVEADETNVDEVIKKVLEHTGKSSTGKIDRNRVSTTTTYTWDDYEKSLTEEDVDYLVSDTMRILAMHKNFKENVLR